MLCLKKRCHPRLDLTSPGRLVNIQVIGSERHVAQLTDVGSLEVIVRHLPRLAETRIAGADPDRINQTTEIVEVMTS